MSDNYDKVSLLLPMNGANNGTVFTDYSSVPKTVTATGAVTSTAQFKHYDSSALFASGNYLTVSNSTDFDFGSGEFCVELWFRSSSETLQHLIDRGDATGFTPWWLQLRSDGVIRARAWSSGSSYIFESDSSSSGFNDGNWHHVAFTRSGSTFRLFVDGVINATQTSASGLGTITQSLWIGRNRNNIVQNFVGNMQDIRITKGAALYTANFTPPTRLVGTISNAAVGAAKILDAAGNPAERTVHAVPRSAPVRVFSDVSNASGEFEIQAPAGVDHSVIALADETDLRNDIVHRVIPE